MQSKEFRQRLTAVVVRELQSLSAQPVKEVVDRDAVRKLIKRWDPGSINRTIIADLVINGSRRMQHRLSNRSESLLGMLDAQLAADVEALLTDEMELSAFAEDFVAKMMREEFVRRLFTDIIFTALVSFYQRVNPLFGAITVRVLEEQIKGFIHLFMPTIQARATAFALGKQNQRILLDFTREILRQLLNEPLRNYAAATSPAQRAKAEALTRKAVENSKLDALVRKGVLAAWDDAYNTVRHMTVGEVVRFEEHADWFAELIVELILPALSRPHVLQFVAAEAALAAAVAIEEPAPTARATASRESK